MRIGIIGGGINLERASVDDVVAAARTAAEQGFTTYWLPQSFGYDALTVLSIIGREVSGIEVGTAVVPTYPRHPVVLAAQALTVQATTGGRLALGIGLSHQVVIEAMFGYSFAKPVRHMREYLSILGPLLQGEQVTFRGESLSTSAGLVIPGEAPAPPVLVAALGSQMLHVAGRLGDGTITWMTGPATLREHIVPTIGSAAKEASRPMPRVVAGLPVCVTDDAAAAHERAARIFAGYGLLPSYRAMLDREGASGPADVAIVGDEKAVAAAIGELADAGATDFSAAEFGRTPEERQRTRALLQSLL